MRLKIQLMPNRLNVVFGLSNARIQSKVSYTP
jgi:hypothetical protein